MNRKWIWMLISVLAALLSACTAKSEGVDTSSVQHTVTFYDGSVVLGEYLVTDGEHPEIIPETGEQWMDQNGDPADPLEAVVVKDMSFYVRRALTVISARPLLLQAEGGRFEPDAPLTRGEAA